MKQTSEFQLSQWDRQDRIQMEDFNADNLRLENALATAGQERKSMQSTLSGRGNCQIITGSYVGTGLAGSKKEPCRLDFSKKPLIVLIMPKAHFSNDVDFKLRLVRPLTYAVSLSDYHYFTTVTWGDTFVQWRVNRTDATARNQMNVSGEVYHYVALLEADA